MEATIAPKDEYEIEPAQQQREREQHHRHEVEKNEPEHRLGDAIGNRPAADAHRRDRAGVHQQLHLAAPPACASSRVRNILMPPPVEPVLQTMQDRNSIQVGANTGHLPKSCEVSPEVVANETTLNSAWRSAVMTRINAAPGEQNGDADDAHREHDKAGLRLDILLERLQGQAPQGDEVPREIQRRHQHERDSTSSMAGELKYAMLAS